MREKIRSWQPGLVLFAFREPAHRCSETRCHPVGPGTRGRAHLSPQRPLRAASRGRAHRCRARLAPRQPDRPAGFGGADATSDAGRPSCGADPPATRGETVLPERTRQRRGGPALRASDRPLRPADGAGPGSLGCSPASRSKRSPVWWARTRCSRSRAAPPASSGSTDESPTRRRTSGAVSRRARAPARARFPVRTATPPGPRRARLPRFQSG